MGLVVLVTLAVLLPYCSLPVKKTASGPAWNAYSATLYRQDLTQPCTATPSVGETWSQGFEFLVWQSLNIPVVVFAPE
jgi:hypothetical protein